MTAPSASPLPWQVAVGGIWVVAIWLSPAGGRPPPRRGRVGRTFGPGEASVESPRADDHDRREPTRGRNSTPEGEPRPSQGHYCRPMNAGLDRYACMLVDGEVVAPSRSPIVDR